MGYPKIVRARKAYWKKMTKEQRSARMRAIAIAKHAKMTPEERKAHALMMVKAKKHG